jgi:hypothetical protein
LLLNEHPFNSARSERRQPAINSVWLWGIGRLGEVMPVNLPTLYTGDAWLAGLWRLHGTAARSLEEFAGVGEAGTDTLVACASAPGGDAGTNLAFVEAACFAPAKTHLLRGSTAMISLLLGDRTFAVNSRARYRFWRRRRPLSEAPA